MKQISPRDLLQASVRPTIKSLGSSNKPPPMKSMKPNHPTNTTLIVPSPMITSEKFVAREMAVFLANLKKKKIVLDISDF